jgi:GSPII_E N-terminal domain.
MARKKLGEILLERCIIDQAQLTSALAHQRQFGKRLGTVLVAKGFITEEILVKVLAEAMGLQTVDVSKIAIEPMVLHMIPVTTCENNDLIPLVIERTKGKSILTLAMADPLNAVVLNEIEFTTDCKIRPLISTVSGIRSAIRKYYRGEIIDINPLTEGRDRVLDAEFMQLVRPGGEIEMINTSAQTESWNRGAPSEPTQPPPARTQLPPRPTDPAQGMQGSLRETSASDREAIDKLERYFWTLMRILAKKGLLTKEDFLRELKE